MVTGMLVSKILLVCTYIHIYTHICTFCEMIALRAEVRRVTEPPGKGGKGQQPRWPRTLWMDHYGCLIITITSKWWLTVMKIRLCSPTSLTIASDMITSGNNETGDFLKRAKGIRINKHPITFFLIFTFITLLYPVWTFSRKLMLMKTFPFSLFSKDKVSSLCTYCSYFEQTPFHDMKHLQAHLIAHNHGYFGVWNFVI